MSDSNLQLNQPLVPRRCSRTMICCGEKQFVRCNTHIMRKKTPRHFGRDQQHTAAFGCRQMETCKHPALSHRVHCEMHLSSNPFKCSFQLNIHTFDRSLDAQVKPENLRKSTEKKTHPTQRVWIAVRRKKRCIADNQHITAIALGIPSLCKNIHKRTRPTSSPVGLGDTRGRAHPNIHLSPSPLSL